MQPHAGSHLLFLHSAKSKTHCLHWRHSVCRRLWQVRILLLEIAADARAQARMQHLLALAGANKLISSSEHGLLLQMFCRDAISDVLKPDWQAVEAPARDRGVLWTRVHSLQSQVWRPCRWDGFRPARLHHTLKGRDSRQYHLEPCKPHMLMCTIWQGHLTMCVTHSTAVSYLQTYTSLWEQRNVLLQKHAKD